MFERFEPRLFQGFSRHGASRPLSWNFLSMYYTVVPRPTPSSFWALPRLGTIDRLYYYGLGTRFGASRPFDHGRSIAFCTFLRHFLDSSMALNDCFFFSLLERHRQCLVMCSSNVGTGKKSRFERLSPLPESPVSRNCSRSVVLPWAPQGRHSRGTIYPTLEKMLVWLIKSQNGAISICLQKKKKKKKRKEKKTRVPREWSSEAGSMHRWVGYVSPNKHTIYRTDTGIKLLFILLFFFTLLWAHFNKKKKKKKKNGWSSFELAPRGTRRAEQIAARRCTWSTSVLVLRAELVAKDFGLANKQAF